MKNLILFIIAFTLISTIATAKKGLKPLFTGKNLKGWETYIGPKEKDGTPVGLDKDPLGIFTITSLNGVPVIRISGEINGSLATKKEYENYHVRMVFRWGEKVYKSYNSGLLYHSFGTYGDGLGVWMSSHEFQLMTGRMGDSYCMGKSYFEIPVVSAPDGKNFIYSASGQRREIGDGKVTKNVFKKADFEKPKGEWNIVDLYCYDRTSIHVVNGEVVMVNYNSGMIENGKITPLSKGKIQIQSEGGELYVKEISIEPINEIPFELLK